jgi:phthiocerol/phenolphthiocerol synthesis type-I polyketide synthase C
MEALGALADRVRLTKKLRVQRLDLAYPFHTSLMRAVKAPLLLGLSNLAPSSGAVPFLSTIADAVVPGPSLDARYWWRNVREPVLFHEGVQRALDMGKRVFLEIGSRPMLRGHLRDSINQMDVFAVADVVLDDKFDDLDVDPFEHCAIRLLAAGAHIDLSHAFGPDPGAGVELPTYPWRRTPYRFGETIEATGAFSPRPWHPLVGSRDNASLEWRTCLDPELEPTLADHRIQGQVLLPGAAFVEMALTIARDWKDSDAVALTDLEILRPLAFAPNSSREILCRISAPTSTFEIMSRPRLSASPYVLHARGGIIDKLGAAEGRLDSAELGDWREGEALYALAIEFGLEFGPAYRQLSRARRVGGMIEVRLSSHSGDARYGLDPARLDSCFHGLIPLFEDLGRERNAYLPVRFDEIQLIKPGAQLAQARLRIRRADEREIVADYELFDDRGRAIARLSGARYQPVRSRPAATLSLAGLVESWIPATGKLAGAAPAIGTELSEEPQFAPQVELRPEAALIEGWASAAAAELARDLSVDGLLDIDELILSGRLPSENRAWAQTIFSALEASGLLTRWGPSFRLKGQELPPAEAVLTSFAWQHPDRAAELLLAASVGAALQAFRSRRGGLVGASDAAREAYDLRSAPAAAAAKALSERLDFVLGAGAGARGRRILQVGYALSTARVARLAARCGARLTVFDSDARRLERARHRLGLSPEISFCDNLAGLEDHCFEFIVSSGGLSRLSVKRGALRQLARKGVANASLVAIEPAPSLFQSLVFGLSGDWFGDEGECLRSAESWRSTLTRSGLCRARAEATAHGADLSIDIVAHAPESPSPSDLVAGSISPAVEVLIAQNGSAPDEFAAALKQALTRRGAACRPAVGAETATSPGGAPSILVWLRRGGDGDGVRRVAAQCLALKTLAIGLGSVKTRVFVPIDASDLPVAGAVASFLRTVANEMPVHSFHRVAIPGWTPEIAERLAEVLLSETDETDIAIRDESVEVLRYGSPDLGGAKSISGAVGWRLEKTPEGGLDRVSWNPAPRIEPKEGQIEVEVVATGLNFRDVMWALSLLPDDMLEEGFAGPTLGLEFSGRIARVGPNVETFCVGDEVVGFCGGAFSTYVTVDADHAALLPSAVSCESAATVPVAFLTAYYGLIACSDVKAGEWVLIHGGAGGVGMAALQIAQWRRARVIVTAGAQEKRDLMIALGAEYAFDSRSGAFVDDVMRVTSGQGVSVVLNSLAGQAMERSIGLLQPFGRFIELGKRDYLANTPVGLRPFRRNLSYFGVDLDQMLLSRPDLWRRLFSEVLAGFERGDFAPLPYTVFESADVVEAMRLMQQSGHIGKILVRPPPAVSSPNTPKRHEFRVDPARTHLVVGGLGGFGVETARWLVERGARHLVLVGRRGVASELAVKAIAEMRGRGAEIRVEALDIADRARSEALLSALKQEMPPLAGVVHAAMVLVDAIVANIDEPRLLDVLRPKIAGAENLERLTIDLKLDYFVLFSSATTVIGSPGQGAYVAANGFLEGLARRRRAVGLPALAVAWGAIDDAGVLARSTATREALAARTGVRGIKAWAALDLMAEALAFEGGPSGDGVVGIADMNWSASRSNLKGLTSPSYGRLLNALESDEAHSRGDVDFRELIQRQPPEVARRAIAEIVIEELARILRMPREDVSRSKPLSEIGLDSLMAVELTLALETRLGLDSPLGEAAGAFNVTELALRILDSQLSGDHNFIVSEGLAQRHLGGAERAEVVELLGRFEGVNTAAVANLTGDIDEPR